MKYVIFYKEFSLIAESPMQAVITLKDRFQIRELGVGNYAIYCVDDDYTSSNPPTYFREVVGWEVLHVR